MLKPQELGRRCRWRPSKRDLLRRHRAPAPVPARHLPHKCTQHVLCHLLLWFVVQVGVRRCRGSAGRSSCLLRMNCSGSCPFPAFACLDHVLSRKKTSTHSMNVIRVLVLRVEAISRKCGGVWCELHHSLKCILYERKYHVPLETSSSYRKVLVCFSCSFRKRICRFPVFYGISAFIDLSTQIL
jgi:hypothetical protein